ncbi:hypothetical protein AHiyo8_12760 [Arthrobacter sp. Hiyo8]|nr:hypothetical protein AHiyo8_12760 [Arthrobacter sp. Hiyo8]
MDRCEAHEFDFVGQGRAAGDHYPGTRSQESSQKVACGLRRTDHLVVLSRRAQFTKMRGNLRGGTRGVVGDIAQAHPDRLEPLQGLHSAGNRVRTCVDNSVQVGQNGVKTRYQ